MSVDSPSREYTLMQLRWQQMRDCVAGSEQVKSRGTVYLPQLAGHAPRLQSDPYWDYNKRALFYNATGRTIDGLDGMVFRRPPIVDLPPAADELKDDIDGLGRAVEDFAAALLREVLTTGRAGLLVDHTRAQGPDFTESEDIKIGVRPPTGPELRPYIVLYQTEDVLDVVYETFGGVRRPVQVRLHEVIEAPSETEFETDVVEQIRVLELVDGTYTQRVFIKQDGTDPQTGKVVQTFVEHEELTVRPTLPDGRTIDEIPFWLVGTGTMMPGKIEPPPLLDLSDVNLAHYRTDADFRNALHIAGVPTPVFSGQAAPEEPIKLGTHEGIFMSDPAAKAYYLSYGAEGVAALRTALTDLESQMAFLGARMLQPDRPGVEAAETARIHRMGEISILARISNMISNQMTAAVQFLLSWAGIPTTDKHVVRLNDDFLPTQAPPQLLAEMVKTWQAKGCSHDSLWRFMQEGELVDPRRTVEEELTIIDKETPELEAEEQELGIEGQRVTVEQQKVSLEQQKRDGETPSGPPRREAA